MAYTQNKNHRKGYRRVIREESGKTKEGKLTVVATYRPFLGLSKVVEKNIEHKTPTSSRKKLTIKEKTKRYNDGSVKSYKYIVKQNGSIVSEVTKPKVKYKKGEKPNLSPDVYGPGEIQKQIYKASIYYYNKYELNTKTN